MRRFRTQFDKRPVKDGVFPCDTLLPGDGEDPRYDAVSKRVPNRKALQLCAQVQDTLNLSMGELGDELLRETFIQSVVPAPDSSQLMAVLLTAHDPDEVMLHLQGASGLLRNIVANGINRKRAPQLRFAYAVLCLNAKWCAD